MSALRVERLLDLRCRLFAQCRNAVARLDLDSPDVKARRPAVNTERDRRIVAATTVAFFTRLEREDSIDHVYTSAEASPALAKKCLHDHARPHYADRPNSRDQFVDRNEADAYWAIGVVIRSTVSHEDTRLHDPADVHPEDDGSLRAVVRHGARRIVVVLGHSAVKLLVERLGGFITAREPTGRRRFVACHEWLDGLLAWLADAGDVHRFLAAVDAAAAWLAAAGTEHPSPLARARLEIEVEGERRAEARQLIAVDARLHDILGGSAA